MLVHLISGNRLYVVTNESHMKVKMGEVPRSATTTHGPLLHRLADPRGSLWSKLCSVTKTLRARVSDCAASKSPRTTFALKLYDRRRWRRLYQVLHPHMSNNDSEVTQDLQITKPTTVYRVSSRVWWCVSGGYSMTGP